MDKAVTAAIATIPETSWIPIRYPNAIYDEQEHRWISDAEGAETTYTAFSSRTADRQVTARLIVRRVKRLHPATGNGQGELLPGHRHHAVFTDSQLTMLHAETCHRGHAIVEQVVADLRTARSRTCRPDRSRRTAPGWSAPRSRST